MQAIEPETGTCSLGQDGRPKTPGTSWRQKEIARLGPVPFREIPRDAQKERSPNRHVFLEARKGAPTNQGPARPDRYVEAFGGFAKHNCRQRRDFCPVPPGPNFVTGGR
jgi:hypothetical protein